MRDRFSNRLGFILISAGCAIGIGNVWRFPYIVGQYGGAAFVLIYLFFLVILGLPVMVMEYSVGRASQKSAALSFDVLEPKGTKWHFMKYVAMAGNYILMMFYTSVCGWLFYYFYKMLMGDFNGLNVSQINNEFGLMLSNPLIQVGMMFIVVCIGFFICSKGLQNGVEKVSTSGSSIVKAVASGMKSAAGSISTTAASIINIARNNITNKKSSFISAGISLMSGLASGLKSISGSVSRASTSAASAGASGARTYYGSFYSSGVYLVSGFAAGIRDNIRSAASAAETMAASASAAARAKLNINSPSRVFYAIGGFAGQGFINALTDYKEASYEAGSKIALSARDGINKNISKVTNSIKNGMDSTPTIRPVMDLGNVQTGIDAISGMFNNTSFDASANIGAIGSMMDDRRQNGVNDDVVNAIERLNKGLSGLNRPSYNINGVTYDNGSEISEAVETLVRAARIERRR